MEQDDREEKGEEREEKEEERDEIKRWEEERKSLNASQSNGNVRYYKYLRHSS